MKQLKFVLPGALFFFSFTVSAQVEKPAFPPVPPEQTAAVPLPAVPPVPPEQTSEVPLPPPPNLKMIEKHNPKHLRKLEKGEPLKTLQPFPPPPPPTLPNKEQL